MIVRDRRRIIYFLTLRSNYEYGILQPLCINLTKNPVQFRETPLVLAAGNDHVDAVRALIELGANKEAKSFVRYLTLPSMVARYGSLTSCCAIILTKAWEISDGGGEERRHAGCAPGLARPCAVTHTCSSTHQPQGGSCAPAATHRGAAAQKPASRCDAYPATC